VTGAIAVAAVDDHPIIRDTLGAWIERGGENEGGGDIVVVATAATVDGLLAGNGCQADVVLLDLDLGDGTTVAGNVTAIRAAGPAVVVLSAADQPSAVRAAVGAGACGYVLKSEQASQIRTAIRAAAADGQWISPRLAYILAADDTSGRPALSNQERRVLQLYAAGLPMKSAARKMGISEETAKQYIRRVKEKYASAGRASRSKSELYYRAVEDGHLQPPL
jgi:DNA-binding NarL/FixJ family response regulator